MESIDQYSMGFSMGILPVDSYGIPLINIQWVFLWDYYPFADSYGISLINIQWGFIWE